jgi:hypothetical protein
MPPPMSSATHAWRTTCSIAVCARTSLRATTWRLATCGAYTNVQKMPFIRAAPAMLSLDAEGRVNEVLRRAERTEDVLATYAAELLVTGCYRSGTTLLEKLLHAHPASCVASQPFPVLYAYVKNLFDVSRGLLRRYPLGHRFLRTAIGRRLCDVPRSTAAHRRRPRCRLRAARALTPRGSGHLRSWVPGTGF